jgi:hypothetical protein
MCPGRTAAKFRAAIGGSFFAKHESMVPRIKSQKQKIAFFASAAAAAQLWADMSSVRACHIPSGWSYDKPNFQFSIFFVACGQKRSREARSKETKRPVYSVMGHNRDIYH